MTVTVGADGNATGASLNLSENSRYVGLSPCFIARSPFSREQAMAVTTAYRNVLIEMIRERISGCVTTMLKGFGKPHSFHPSGRVFSVRRGFFIDTSFSLNH